MEEEDEVSVSPYEDGEWVWDDHRNQLVFHSNIVSQNSSEQAMLPQNIAGAMMFNDEPDLFEQLKFQRYYRRRAQEDDVVTLQDIKDVVLFIAPAAILTVNVIKILHMPLMERFLRALILYMQYYLQVTDEMSHRDMEAKIHTPLTQAIEKEFSENLADLRLIVGKEYGCMLLGGEEFGKYHHMGARKLHSLTNRDAILYETLFRLNVYIVWIALGRKSKLEIELEINRIFKSDKFNFADHQHKYQGVISSKHQSLILGRCLRRDAMLNTTSPVMNEVLCDRRSDPQLYGVGVVEYSKLCPRLKFVEKTLILPEEKFQEANITLGILGTDRKRFDVMLKEITGRKSSTHASQSRASAVSVDKRASRASTSASIKSRALPLYNNIVLPEERPVKNLEDTFPDKLFKRKDINEQQKRKWIQRIANYHRPRLQGQINKRTL